MTAGPDATPAPAQRDVPVPEGFDIRPYVSGIGAHLAAPANVVMQLGLPAVGHGVLESPVESGSAMRHPVRRARTTFTYLAVALLGTDDERAAFRRAVNRQHAQVRSRPGAEVEYDALDPRLQTWVAACLYYGAVDVHERLHGPVPEQDADGLYAYGARLGTTLQMRPEDWPADRAAFARYWEESLAQVRIDPAVAAMLLDLVNLRNLPRVVALLLGRFSLLVTTGFLPPVFREALGLPWDERRQRRFDRLMRWVGAADRRLPRTVRLFPFNLYLRDLRLRRRLGRPLL